ncbi:hypothetical protein OH764_10595 [Burkholderia sp. M6-3]
MIFSELVKPMAGKPVLGRILLDGEATTTRAYKLAEWLKLQPFARFTLNMRTGPGYSDLGKSQQILFWALK